MQDNEKSANETSTEFLEDSDIIFTAISTSAYSSFKEAEQAVAMMYVTDPSFSRAGISHALKRLERHYNNPKASEIAEKIKILKEELEKKQNISYEVTGWNNFARVFRLPSIFPNEFCFDGGHPVNFQMVDWFNPVQNIGMPGVSEKEWEKKFGNFDGMKSVITERELRETLIPFLQQKVYAIKDHKFLIICDFGASIIFEGKYIKPISNERFA